MSASGLPVPPPFHWQSDGDPLARYPKFQKKFIQSSFKLLQKVLMSSIPNEELVFCVDVAVLPYGWRRRRLFYITSFFGAQLAERLTISLFWIYRAKATGYQIYYLHAHADRLMFKFRIHCCYSHMTMPMQDRTPVRYGAYHLDFVPYYSVYPESDNSSW